MNTNDPIDKILAKAAAFEKLANAPAKPLSPKLLAEVNAIFSKPTVQPASSTTERILTKDEVTSLVLMVISHQSLTTLDLIDALKKQHVNFEGGYGIIFGFLQEFEMQGYLTAEKKLRRGRELKFYSVTTEGHMLLQQTSANKETLYSLAVQIATGIVVA